MQELTLSELKERLIAQVDPDTLIELLGITMEDLVEALSDQIEDHYETLMETVTE